MEELSRRHFIQGALTIGAGVAGAGALAACAPESSNENSPSVNGDSTKKASMAGDYGNYPWPAEAPEIADSDVEKEVEADVIIVGLGLAGICAARAAAEEGASLITFEKSDSPNTRSGDFAVIGGETMKGWGLDNVVDPNVVADHEMDECSYFPKRAILYKWAVESGKVFDWFISAYPNLYIAESNIDDLPDTENTIVYPYFKPLPEGYDYTKEIHPCYPSSVSFKPDQTAVSGANWDLAQSEASVDAYFGHFAEKLIKEGDRIVGCYARNAETGKYVKATCKKGLILATGEYSSNQEFMDFFVPAVNQNGVINWWPDRDVEGNPVNVGDGFKLGNWVGARIQQHHAPMIHWMGKVLGGTGMDMSPVGTAPFLHINKNGQRFMNEDIPGQQMENQIELQPEGTVYQIWDAKWGEQWKAFPVKHGKATYYAETVPEGRGADPASPGDFITPEAVEAAVEIGRVVKADTIEELVAKLEGLDSDAALKTIERYNDQAHKGVDEDFGKRADRLFPVEEGPFYGTVCGLGDILVCIGGLESDEECRVYAEDRSIIQGFYVAGNIQGNRFAVQYPIALKGVSHGMAMYYGYVAGKNAVNQI